MKQRFKEFEGRVLCNNRISTLPRMQVFKCVVMTNGTYACEVWNYTRAEIDRLEKHYFRLLRNTLLMRKYDTTYREVMDQARVEGVVKIYPIECFVQRQQLKFLWKVLHLKDEALQKIVLHGRLDKTLSIGRTGRKRTYKQCITEALTNFNVTMQQCMDSTKRDWAKVIEESGMDAAVYTWEKRPKAATAIDVDWRAAGRKSVKRKVASATEVRLMSAVEIRNMDSDGEGRDIDESASEESLDEDEFAHVPGSPDACADGEGENRQDQKRSRCSARYNVHKQRPLKRQ